MKRTYCPIVRPMNRKVVAYINGRRERRLDDDGGGSAGLFGSCFGGTVRSIGRLEGLGDEREPLKRRYAETLQLTRWYLCNKARPRAKVGFAFIAAAMNTMAWDLDDQFGNHESVPVWYVLRNLFVKIAIP